MDIEATGITSTPRRRLYSRIWARGDVREAVITVSGYSERTENNLRLNFNFIKMICMEFLYLEVKRR